MLVSVLNHQKEVEHTVEVLPKKDKEAVTELTISEVERDSKEKVVMVEAKAAAIMVVAKAVAIMVAAKDMAITMVVISDSIVAPPTAIGRMC